jgi:hypothetical protein
MAYRVVVELEDAELEPDEVVSAVNYLGEVLGIMGYSYSLSCFKDGKDAVVHRESPKVAV